ncbi:MAG: hypothetical protein JXA18_06910 [Chitinispirillaceae bacterium]|nr:hypothetical protein [Chitinispirillaceae bacterium]
MKTLEDLKIENNEVSQWMENSFVKFNQTDMYAIVNGGATTYINNGMLEGYEQKMSKSGTEYNFFCWLLDFGTAEKAILMYNKILEERQSDKEDAGDFPESVAFIDKSPLYGRDGYAHFDKYFIWYSFDGYGTNYSEAKANLIGFLEVTKSKIDG